ncbi:MAG: hypothetical protein JRG94_00570 [Deltaproteobacteria bacterium]|nr:hypothetical protein [Deltaproteobacteria bacterium]
MTSQKPDASPMGRILASKTITAEDVLALRRDVFSDSLVNRNEVAAIFQLDRGCVEKAEQWTHFFVEALTDHFVWQADPYGYVNEEGADYLSECILQDGRIDGIGELELLINIASAATSCPESLNVLILEAVKESVLSPEVALYGRDRRPGVVTAMDCELIRKAIYGKASGGGYTTTRREADLLFELNRESNRASNDEAWQDLFVKAIGSHLMFPLPVPRTPSADETRRREAWMNSEVGGVRDFAFSMARKMSLAGLEENFREVDPFGSRGEAEAENRAKESARASFERESIDPNEALWLLEWIKQDHDIDENERALLIFIKQECPSIDPMLNPLLARIDET